MLIGWATPFNYRSAIGKFSRAVADELSSRGHAVTILRTETGDELKLTSLESDFEVTSCHLADLESFDLLVANFGNHAPYHSQCLPLVAKRAPYGIFHDAEMSDFGWGLQHRHGIGIPLLRDFVRAEDLFQSKQLVSAKSAPLLASLAAMCWGAMVHAPHYRELIADHCSGPVDMNALCYPDPGLHRDLPPLENGRPQVIIFGVILDQKQPRRAMHALAQLLKTVGPIDLHLAGAIEERLSSELTQLAWELGIAPPHSHGYVSDEQLQSLIEGSQAVLVLRYPITEGGSASLATALYRGRPIIVSDIASYSMVPDDLVAKVSYGDDPDDLAKALGQILHDPAAAQARAIKAREWAEHEYAAEHYVDALLPALERHKRYARLADISREAIEALRAPNHDVDIEAIKDFGQVIDWFDDAQEQVRA